MNQIKTSPDQVTLIDRSDRVIGAMDKIEAHRGEGQLHRAISVYLFRKNQAGEVELLVQKRSSEKIVGAGQWANTVCGNVWPRESYEACARRRLQVELGISDKTLELQDIYNFIYQVRCNEEFSEHELDHIFIGWFDAGFEPNPAEVSETAWLKWGDVCLTDWRARSEYIWAPWFEIMMEDGALLGKINTHILGNER